MQEGGEQHGTELGVGRIQEMTGRRIWPAATTKRANTEVQQDMARVELVGRIQEQAARCAAAALFTYIWAQALLRDLRAELVATVAAGPAGGHPLRSRAAAQGLVEWSLAAAVLAFVGLAAWQLAGTAITNAVNRAIGNLDKAGN
jgi:hypothetical protein